MSHEDEDDDITEMKMLIIEEDDDGGVVVDDPSKKLEDNERIGILVKALFTELGEYIVDVLAGLEKEDSDEDD